MGPPGRFSGVLREYRGTGPAAPIHRGRPTRRREDIVERDGNLASRIVNVAGPGEVLLPEAAVVAANGALAAIAEIEELGPVVMKGIPEPVRLYRAVRA